MELSVLNIQGKETGKKVTLSDEIFGIEPNEHVVWLDVKQFLANQRQGTHKSKERAEVSRSTRKLKKQKGTGGARAGSAKSPLMKGGGRIFGPVPRDYSFKVNKKVKSLARQSAFAAKAQGGNVTILEGFSFDAPKTKSYIAMLDALSLSGKKTLLILPEDNKNVYLSGRNVPKAQIGTAGQVNTYDLVNATQLLIVEGAIAAIESSFSK
ncbi:large subunit ribosomal protein L4 [Arcicella aurantiaca]|uniref:Large ribosomal subunit protein uL4 n=1 Tax=Arcicella aurantiaca TaxID=591202 RepID=A0A316EES7_9BACT|nr:50S ribosomal protein L4 [Arcicella aurantiaca]PWK27823.1 large subunit ribosomal protein L4 [Arcicella aurantiaca]